MADDAIDTSVSEDTSNDTDDIDLEDIEVDVADIQSEDDEDTAEDTEAEEATEDDTDDSEEDTDSEADTSDDDSEQTDEQSQAEHNKQMYQQRQQEKQARENRIREAQADYVADAQQSEDPLAAAVRQLEVDAYNNTVERNETRVQTDYQRAMADFSVLQTTDPVIQQEIDATIDAFQSQHVLIDQYGNPLEIRGNLYATLQAKADSIEKLTGIRNQRQEQSKSKEKSKTLTVPRRAPQKAKVDPDMAAFDEEADW